MTEKKQRQVSICETGNMPVAKWHLRWLTDKGPMFGGGADTESLCGIEVKWDLEVPINVETMSRVCESCRRFLLSSVSGES